MDILNNLDYYKYFYYAAKYGSISKAAKKLNITQPAATKVLHNLEKQLDCPLFLRTGRGVVLTMEGEILYDELIPAFEHLQEAEKRIAQSHSLEHGILRIGVDSLVSQTLIQDSVARYNQLYPGIYTSISKLYLPTILTDLANEVIDCAVILTIRAPFKGYEMYQSLIQDSSFKQYLLYTLTDDFVVGSRYSYLAGKFIEIGRLAKIPFIYPTIEVLQSQYYTSTFQRLSPDFRKNSIPISGAASRIALTKYNHGFTYFPSCFFEKDYQEKTLFPVFTNLRMREYELQILIKNNAAPRIAVEKFLEVVPHI